MLITNRSGLPRTAGRHPGPAEVRAELGERPGLPPEPPCQQVGTLLSTMSTIRPISRAG